MPFRLTRHNYIKADIVPEVMQANRIIQGTTQNGMNMTNAARGELLLSFFIIQFLEAYDALGRLINWQDTASNPTQTATYAYDGEGARVQQVVTASGMTTTTDYIGQNEEVNTTGSTTTTTKYYDAGIVSVTNVKGTLSYLVKDFLGSATMALDNAGNITATTLYAPYGAVRYSTGAMPTTRSYTSMASDPSGLSYDHARYYDSGVGQFISADAVQGPNRYGYVAGNPETRIDPTGQSWRDEANYYYYHDDVNPYFAWLETIEYGGAGGADYYLARLLERGVTYYRLWTGRDSGQDIGDTFYYMSDRYGNVEWIPQYVTTYPKKVMIVNIMRKIFLHLSLEAL
jgi:RHS repeat-associated core domain